jgi:hypothetical protein
MASRTAVGDGKQRIKVRNDDQQVGVMRLQDMLKHEIAGYRWVFYGLPTIRVAFTRWGQR